MNASDLTLRPPAAFRYWLGIICACVIPMLAGLNFFRLYLLGEDPTGDQLILLPCALIFTFGTPVVAILSARRVKERAPISFSDLFGVALKRASLVQLFFYVAEMLIFMVAVAIRPGGHNPNDAGELIGTGALLWAMGLGYHVVLWAVITLPLTLLCSFIFRMVSMTKTPVVNAKGIFS